MKKTLVALAVTAFAASASAVTIYDNDGTSINFDGSLRFIMEEAGTTTKTANGVKSGQTRSNLRNAGTRIALRVKHDINEDLFAFARTELRFDGVNSSRDKFGDIYTKRAYVGLGSKQFGEVTFGRQLTIADDYGLTKDYEYGMIPKSKYIETAGNSVVRYDYKGIEGLQVGANYNFAQSENDKGGALKTPIKNAYGIGATYETEVAPAQTLFVKGGYGYTNYETHANYKHRKDGVIFSLGYKVENLTLVHEAGYKFEKEDELKTHGFYVSPGVIYQVTPAVSVYGNYIYERLKSKDHDVDVSKSKTHGFLAGADYKFHKQVVAFVEGSHKQTKSYTGSSTYTGKEIDKAIGVGMRVYW